MVFLVFPDIQWQDRGDGMGVQRPLVAEATHDFAALELELDWKGKLASNFGEW